MFQFSAFAYFTTYLQYVRLPHSETHGSIRICRSPWLIAACRVLLRLREPRHPPCALLYFLHPKALLLALGLLQTWIAPRPTVAFSSLILVSFQYVKELLRFRYRDNLSRRFTDRGE